MTTARLHDPAAHISPSPHALPQAPQCLAAASSWVSQALPRSPSQSADPAAQASGSGGLGGGGPTGVVFCGGALLQAARMSAAERRPNGAELRIGPLCHGSIQTETVLLITALFIRDVARS
jgi:hypothetical protein